MKDGRELDLQWRRLKKSVTWHMYNFVDGCYSAQPCKGEQLLTSATPYDGSTSFERDRPLLVVKEKKRKKETSKNKKKKPRRAKQASAPPRRPKK